MTTHENEEYVLGEEVTSSARTKSRGGTAVVAVRLSVEEIAELESTSRATGKSLSQVLREAIRKGLRYDDEIFQPTVTISIQDGVTTTTGAARQYSQAAVAEKREEETSAA